MLLEAEREALPGLHPGPASRLPLWWGAAGCLGVAPLILPFWCEGEAREGGGKPVRLFSAMLELWTELDHFSHELEERNLERRREEQEVTRIHLKATWSFEILVHHFIQLLKKPESGLQST